MFRDRRPALFGFWLMGATAMSVAGAAAKGYHVVYSFQNSQDGDEPHAGLIKDGRGNLYGTTFSGGSGGFNGNGTVYRLASDGSKAQLYSFTGQGDGNYPNALIMDKSGNLVGTTQQGGDPDCDMSGCGVVFEVAPDGTETVLYTFHGGNDGGQPLAALLPDGKGGFYGTASGAGAHRLGLVFDLSSKGKETVLHAFAGGSDGDGPQSALVADRSGNLYGTTKQGGGSGCSSFGCGTIYEVTPTGAETVLYAFKGDADGANPVASLIRDKAGNLYGTTGFGGDVGGCGGTGCGTVFKLSSHGALKVLFTFTGGNDGGQPVANLVSGANGDLYGTTLFGGPDGYGVVFSVAADGKEHVLHTFTDGDDGAYPWGALLKVGNKFVSTASGGGATDFGTVFSVGK